jgi:rare lipoprotein A
MKPVFAILILVTLAACSSTNVPEIRIRPPEAPRWAPAELDGVKSKLWAEAAPQPKAAVEQAEAAPTPADDDSDVLETGLASWYGPRFHGRLTANGERFDSRALTAAHPTLPLGTDVIVKNLETGRSVTLRVNDRFPGRPGYVIDVSRAAAVALGFERAGRAQVALLPVEEG